MSEKYTTFQFCLERSVVKHFKKDCSQLIDCVIYFGSEVVASPGKGTIVAVGERRTSPGQQSQRHITIDAHLEAGKGKYYASLVHDMQ